MNSYARIAIAAAAVIVVAVVGYSLLPGNNNLGSLSTPTPTLTPTIAPTASPIPSAVPSMPTGLVPAGTYAISSFSNARFAVTVPEGWTYEGGWLSKGDVWEGNGVVFTPFIVTHVYLDACKWKGTLREAASRDTLVSFLGAQKPFRIDPVETLVGSPPNGYPAARLVFEVAADADFSGCDDAFMRLWPGPGPDETSGLPIHVGQTTTVYVVEVDGKTTALVSVSNADSDPAAVEELAAIMRSIRIPG